MLFTCLPNSPQWNNSNCCVATPDGGFLYIGSKNVTYFGTKGQNQVIKNFPTRNTAISIDIDPSWSEKTVDSTKKKYFAVVAGDNSIQVYDFDLGCAIRGHSAHWHDTGNTVDGHTKKDLVVLSFMCNRSILSISPNEIVMYCVTSNTYCIRPLFIKTRCNPITFLKCSPNNEHLFAVGTMRGVVLFCDLQKSCVISTFSGHTAAITSISWNSAIEVKSKKESERKENDDPKHKHTLINKTNNAVKEDTAKTVEILAERKTPNASREIGSSKSKKKSNLDNTRDDDIFDIYSYDYLEDEFGTPVESKEESRIKIITDEQSAEENGHSKNFDFAEACQSLKEDIISLKVEQNFEENAVTLDDCKNAKRSIDATSSGGQSECSSGGISRNKSLSCLSNNSEKIEGKQDGINKKKEILHQAEVHSAPPYEEVLRAENVKNQRESELKPTIANADEISREVHELLISGSSDGSVCIWDLKTKLFVDTIKARNTNTRARNTKIQAEFINDSELITLNKQGELQQWEYKHQDPGQRFKEKRFEFGQKGIAAMSVDRKNNLIWYITILREIICQDMISGKIMLKYACASTNIIAMKECPNDQFKIAMGLSDRRIAILNTASLTNCRISMDNFTTFIDAAVTSVAWSPDGRKIAFSTVEGRVGIVKADHPKNEPYLFHPICGKPVYSINYTGDYIFVVCIEKLAIYDYGSNIKDPYIVPGIEDLSTIKVHGKYLLCGTQRGHIQIYKMEFSKKNKFEFEKVQTLNIMRRYISDISFCPTEPDKLAIVGMSNSIHLYKLIDGLLTPLQTIEISDKIATCSSVSWGKVNENRLLTCGQDGTVRVWELKNEKYEEIFYKIFGCPVFCGMFMPSNENIILVTGRTLSVEMIDIQTTKPDQKVSLKKIRKFASENLVWAHQILLESNLKHISKQHESSERELVSLMSEMDVNQDSTSDNAGNLVVSNKSGNCGKQVNSYLKNPPTLLCMANKEINKINAFKMKSLLTDQTSTYIASKLFGTAAQAQSLLAEEFKNYKTSVKEENINLLVMSKLHGNLKDEITTHIEKKKLTEWHVSSAPTISYSFWQKCCEAYAAQLFELGHYMTAVYYMLLIHKERDAIDMLLQKNYYKEALLIARIYLLKEDSLIKKIIGDWISYFSANGHFYGASYIALLSGDKVRATENLSRLRTVDPELPELLKIINEM